MAESRADARWFCPCTSDPIHTDDCAEMRTGECQGLTCQLDLGRVARYSGPEVIKTGTRDGGVRPAGVCLRLPDTFESTVSEGAATLLA